MHRFLIPEGPLQQALTRHPTDGAAGLVSSLQNWEVNEPFVTKQCVLVFHFSTRKQTINSLVLPLVPFLAKQGFHFSGSGHLLVTADSTTPANQTPQILHTKGPEVSPVSLQPHKPGLHHSQYSFIFQAPTEPATELSTLNGFSRPKFQRPSSYNPSPKHGRQVSHQCPTTL